MADNIKNLVLEHLKALRAEIAAVKSDTEEIRERLCSHDNSIVALRRQDVNFREDQVCQ